MNALRKLSKLIFGPMPLNEFRDYNEYWQKREMGGRDEILHRFIWIADRIPRDAAVLDIGCGDGQFLRYLRDRGITQKLYGLDVSPVAVAALRQHGIRGDVVQVGDMSLLAAERCDVAVLMEVLEHVHEAEDMFRQTLKCGAQQIFVSIPNTGYIVHRLRLLIGGRFPVTTILYHMKEHIRFWTVADFKQWVELFGCRVHEYAGQERTQNRLHLLLLRWAPSLFAGQLIYEIRRVR